MLLRLSSPLSVLSALCLPICGRGTASIGVRSVGTVFAMKLPDGTQRLIAAKVSPQSIDIIAQQDLPSGMSVTKLVINLRSTSISISLCPRCWSFDLLLIGPRLRNQASLSINWPLNLKFSDIVKKLQSCSQEEINLLQQWLNKPSSTPGSNPVKDILATRQRISLPV